MKRGAEGEGDGVIAMMLAGGFERGSPDARCRSAARWMEGLEILGIPAGILESPRELSGTVVVDMDGASVAG